MKVSIILPTRKRFQSLRRSIDSLLSTATRADVEVLLAVDDDDLETLERLKSEDIPGSKVLVGPRLGYINLHLYVNQLCQEATGDWVVLWNDDALMRTQGWDEILEEYLGQMVVLNPATNHVNHPRENCIFPIVPKKMVELLGHFSLSNHNDTYIENISNSLGIRRDVAITVCHDRADLTGGNDDEVYAEREFTTGSFYGPENQANVRRDIQVLAEYLEDQSKIRIGFVGLGKLGLPCALAIESFGGHKVFGTDANSVVLDNIKRRCLPYREEGAKELLDKTSIRVCNVDEIVSNCEIVFVAVQTPHDPRFEGVTPLPNERVDFDYQYLVKAVTEVAESARRLQKEIIVTVISTVLPGTIAREVEPLLNEYTKLCYNPFFIAMGTTIHDFMNPEFVLMGSDSPQTVARMREFYASLHEASVVEMSIESAELTKVAYNTFIGMKIAFANTLMEVCDATGANVDQVSDALGLATNRLISPKYMRAGMGDGGGCHPRDNIAMSYLARKHGLSYDLFESVMLARERQTAWLAEITLKEAVKRNLPIVILGKAFKPETNLIVGSPALLLKNFLETKGASIEIFDPVIDDASFAPKHQAVYIVATMHAAFQDWPYPTGSLVLDPWGYIVDRAGIHVKRIGRGGATSITHAVVEVVPSPDGEPLKSPA